MVIYILEDVFLFFPKAKFKRNQDSDMNAITRTAVGILPGWIKLLFWAAQNQ